MTADLSKKSSKVNSSSNSGEMQVTNKHPFSNHFSPYPWYGPGPKPSYPFVSVNTSQSLCFGFPPSAAAGGKDGVVAAAEHPPILKGGVAPMSAPWLGRTPLPFSNLDAFWDKAFGLPRPLGPGLRSMYPPSIAKAPSEGPLNECLGGGIEGRGEPGERSSSDDGVSERKRPRKDSFSMNVPNGHHVPHYRQGSVMSDRLSAFRPVGRSTTHPHEDDHSMYVDEDDDDDEEEERVVDEEDNEEIDVTDDDCCTAEDLSQKDSPEGRGRSGDRRSSFEEGDDKLREDQVIEEKGVEEGARSWPNAENHVVTAAATETVDENTSVDDHVEDPKPECVEVPKDSTSAETWSEVGARSIARET